MIDITKHMNEEQKNIYNKYKNIYPFPAIDFARDLGYRVAYFEVNEKNKHIAGAVNYETNTIFLNQLDNYKRQLFTLGHEIAHIILGHKEIGVDYRITIYKTTSDKEIMANKFSATLLMPEKEFKFQWEKNQEEIYKISDYFGTSEIATIIRAKELGLITDWSENGK